MLSDFITNILICVLNESRTGLERHEGLLSLINFSLAFVKNHSTENALLRVSNETVMAAEAGECSVVLLDLSAAFDAVGHCTLINRLYSLVGTSGSALDCFSSSFSVSSGSYMSDSAPLSCGVPQGSVLDPLLFSLYILPLGKIMSIIVNYVN